MNKQIEDAHGGVQGKGVQSLTGHEDTRKTRLQSFIEVNGIRPAELARVSSVSRQHLLRLRHGRMDPSRRVMVLVKFACTMILHRSVTIGELFDFDDPTPFLRQRLAEHTDSTAGKYALLDVGPG